MLKDCGCQWPHHMELHDKDKPKSDEITHHSRHLICHGFDETKIKSLDQLQILQLLNSCKDTFDFNRKHSPCYPSVDAPNHCDFEEMRNKEPSWETLNYVKGALNEDVRMPLKKEVKGCVEKHHGRKQVVKGSGSTQAILSKNVSQCLLCMEYLLVHHSFCHFSSSLPLHLRMDYDIMDCGKGKQCFSTRTNYCTGGDNALDFRTTKMHCQENTGRNYKCLSCLVHSSCHLGQ